MGKVGQKVVVQRQTAVIQAAQPPWSQDLLETERSFFFSGFQIAIQTLTLTSGDLPSGNLT
jgi:hypothetical protein